MNIITKASLASIQPSYADVPDFAMVRQHYGSDPRLGVGESIQSYVNGDMQRIELQ